MLLVFKAKQNQYYAREPGKMDCDLQWSSVQCSLTISYGRDNREEMSLNVIFKRRYLQGQNCQTLKKNRSFSTN